MQELYRPLPSISGIFFPVAAFVVGVFKSMSGIGINGHLNVLAVIFHLRSEGLNILWRNSTVLAAEKSTN